MALNKGTVKLSKPFGVSASQTVATAAAPKEASANLGIEIGNRNEKNSAHAIRPEIQMVNIAVDPSKLFVPKMLYLCRPIFCPTKEAAASPYAIGKIPAAIMYGLVEKNNASRL